MKVKFVLKDMWVGLYWKTERERGPGCYNIVTRTWYLCLLPCFPIIWETKSTEHWL